MTEKPAPDATLSALPTATEWWPYLQQARAILEASGAKFRRGEDIAAEIEQIRGEPDRVEAISWEQEWQRRHGGPPACSSPATASS
jgi:hypothetical protein